MKCDDYNVLSDGGVGLIDANTRIVFFGERRALHIEQCGGWFGAKE